MDLVASNYDIAWGIQASVHDDTAERTRAATYNTATLLGGCRPLRRTTLLIEHRRIHTQSTDCALTHGNDLHDPLPRSAPPRPAPSPPPAPPRPSSVPRPASVPSPPLASPPLGSLLSPIRSLYSWPECRVALVSLGGLEPVFRGIAI